MAKKSRQQRKIEKIKRQNSEPFKINSDPPSSRQEAVFGRVGIHFPESPYRVLGGPSIPPMTASTYEQRIEEIRRKNALLTIRNSENGGFSRNLLIPSVQAPTGDSKAEIKNLARRKATLGLIARNNNDNNWKPEVIHGLTPGIIEELKSEWAEQLDKAVKNDSVERYSTFYNTELDAIVYKLEVLNRCLDERHSHQRGVWNWVGEDGIQSGSYELVKKKQEKGKFSNGMLDAGKVVKKLDKNIVGCKELKRVIANFTCNFFNSVKVGRKIPAKNMIFAGPSGSGKTLMCENLAKAVGVKYHICDIQSLNPAGYKGCNPENLFEKINDRFDTDEGGILFLDEFDKLYIGGTNSLGYKLEVANELLKVMDGARVRDAANDELDTSNIIVIAAGVFGISGGSDRMVNEDDFLKFGLTEEVMGRMGLITNFTGLEPEQRIPLVKKLLDEYKDFYQDAYSIEMRYTDEILADLAAKWDARFGARGIRKYLASAFNNLYVPDIDEKKGFDLGITKDELSFTFHEENLVK